MIAMEAATPFQVFSCINLIRQLNEEADLFLYTYATDLSIIAGALQKENIFKDVYIIRDIPQKNHISLVKYLLFPEKMFGEIKKKRYDALFISYSGIPNLLLFNVLRKDNNEIKLHFYEDGITSYYNGVFEHSMNVRRLCKIFKRAIDSDFIKVIWLYEPRLNAVTYHDVALKRIEPVSNEKDILSIERVFGISAKAKEIRDSSPIIYFDHNFYKYITKDVFVEFNQNEIVNALADNMKRKITVKISPLADANSSDYNGTLVIASNFDKAPWEMLISNDEMLQERCLISVCSNAVVTPKTVYGREPYVLILGKALMLEGKTNSTDVWTDDMEKFYRRVKELYKEKEKFMIPDSLDEAEEMLRRYIAFGKKDS